MRITNELNLITVPKLEINENNEFYIDEQEVLVVNNEIDITKVVFEKGRWV